MHEHTQIAVFTAQDALSFHLHLRHLIVHMLHTHTPFCLQSYGKWIHK